MQDINPFVRPLRVIRLAAVYESAPPMVSTSIDILCPVSARTLAPARKSLISTLEDFAVTVPVVLPITVFIFAFVYVAVAS